MPDQPILQVQQVSKSYSNRKLFCFPGKRHSKKALDEVSFSVSKGEICGLLGLNGAGKTTLIKILANLVLPDSGSVYLQGKDLLAMSPQLKSRLVGYVNCNERSFYWRLSLLQNLVFFSALYGLHGREGKKRVLEVLELVALSDLAGRRFDRCSSGQKQRLAIARALLADPDLLLLDEPTSSIDVQAAEQLRGIIREQLVRSGGKTALWCTHDLKEAQAVCDRILVVDHGQLVADYSVAALRARLEKRVYTVTLDGAVAKEPAFPDEVELLNSGIEDTRQWFRVKCREDRISVCIEQLVNNGERVMFCSPEQGDIQAFFAELIGKERY